MLSTTSCEKQVAMNTEGVQSVKVSDFNRSGEIHNAFLTNAKDNFEIVESITDKDEKVEVVYQLNKSFVTSLDISSTEKKLLIADLNKTKNLVQEDVLVAKCFGGLLSNESSKNKKTIFEMIQDLKTSGVINDESYQILNSLSNDLKANYEDALSDDQLKKNVLALINDFDNIGYAKNSEGEMAGTILAISIASIEWWEENPDALLSGDSKSRMLAPWVAGDLVGAVWGGATGAIASYAGAGKVNWGSVGIGALSGAISGSTGAIGRISSWF